jgi:hypothetical protein
LIDDAIEEAVYPHRVPVEGREVKRSDFSHDVFSFVKQVD